MAEEKKEAGEKQPESPPLDIVLQVNLDCDGCAQKAYKCLKEADGVESVTLHRQENKVSVKGKADPCKLRDLVRKKIGRKVELISPIPETGEEHEEGAEEEPPTRSPASSSRICLREEQGWIKMKKCNCKPAKFFAVKVSQEGWPYYVCDGCGEKSWVETNEFVGSYNLSGTVNNGNNGWNGETSAVVNMAELKARLAGISFEFKMCTLMFLVLFISVMFK